MTNDEFSERSPRWRRFVPVLSGISLFLASLTLYVQTPHAFEHLIVPLADRFLPGRLEVRKGSFAFPATVELTAMSYHHPETGLSVQSDRIVVRVSAMALLRHRELLFEDVTLERSEIRFTRVSNPASRTDQQTEAPGNTPMPLLPAAVHRLQIHGLTVSIRRDGDEVTASDVSLTMGEIGPGKTGTFDLHGDVTYDDHANLARWKGNVLAKGTIEQSLDRDRIAWNATSDVTLQEWLQPRSPTGFKPITFHHSLTGNCDIPSDTLHNRSSVTARYGSALLGEASLELTRTGRPGGAVMDVGLVIQELTDEALNLLLPEEDPIRIRSTHMGGHATLHAEGDRYAIASTITGRNLQAVSGGKATPPQDIDLLQAGVVDLGTKGLTIDKFQLRVAENGKVRLTGDVGRPLRIGLGRDVVDSDHVASETAPEGEGTLTVSDLDVQALQRWLHVFGLDGFQGVRGGRFNGTVTASSRGKGRAIDWSGHVTMSDVVIAGAGGGAMLEPMTFAHEFHGTVIDLAALRLESYRLTATVKDRISGVVRLSGTIDLKEPTTNPTLKGSLDLASLPGETLNPLLARWTETRFSHALLNGTARAEISRGVISWQLDLRGRRISLWIPQTPQATISMDMTVTQEGRYDRNTGTLQLDKATFREFERSRPAVTALLDNPVRLTFPRTDSDRTWPRMETPLAAFRLEINRLGIEQLRPRLSIWNITALDGIRTGIIDARLTMKWSGEESPASVTGSFNITNIRLDAGALHIRAPLQLRTSIDAAVGQSTLLEFKKVNLLALAEAKILAETEITGSTNLRNSSTDLSLMFTTGDMPAFLARIGVIDEQQLNTFTSGHLTAEGRMTSPGQNSPVSMQATVRSRNLQIQPLPGLFLTYALRAQGALEINAERTAVEFKSVDLALETAGKPAGSLTMNGKWPIAPSETGASVQIVAKNLDGGPFAERSGLLPGRIPGPLPIDADVTVAFDAPSGHLALRGLETIGPVRVARADGGQETATLRIKHDVIQGRGQIHVDELQLAADRPQGDPDHVTATGRMRLTDNREGQLKANVASLDTGWYAALLSNSKSPPPPENRPPSAKHPADRQTSSHPTAALMGFDIDLSIGSITHGQLKIGPGRLTSKRTDGRLNITLEPTGVAGGRVEAAMAIDGRKEVTEIRWSGKGQDLNVATILQAVHPGQDAALKGSGSFETSGNGVFADGPLREHLTGTADITITKGQFIQSKALSFLAKYTKIPELEQMGFDQYRSTWHFNNGAITIDRFSVTGSVASFDGTGSIAQDNAIDMRIFAKIGPSLRERIKIPCMSALLATSDGFTTLPFALRITGAANDPDYSIDTTAVDYMKGPIGGMADTVKTLLRGCREDRSKSRTP